MLTVAPVRSSHAARCSFRNASSSSPYGAVQKFSSTPLKSSSEAASSANALVLPSAATIEAVRTVAIIFFEIFAIMFSLSDCVFCRVMLVYGVHKPHIMEIIIASFAEIATISYTFTTNFVNFFGTSDDSQPLFLVREYTFLLRANTFCIYCALPFFCTGKYWTSRM